MPVSESEIKARSGCKTAIGAVTHTMLVALDEMLKAGELYKPRPESQRQTENNTNASND